MAEKSVEFQDGLRCSFDARGEHSMFCDACGNRVAIAAVVAKAMRSKAGAP
jgi:hypothetical protein